MYIHVHISGDEQKWAASPLSTSLVENIFNSRNSEVSVGLLNFDMYSSKSIDVCVILNMTRGYEQLAKHIPT
jgi:hypothetical protein